MPTRIRFSAPGVELVGELDDSPTALAFRDRLPANLRMSRWGDEYYGRIDADLGIGEADDAREVIGEELCPGHVPTEAIAQDSVGDPNGYSENQQCVTDRSQRIRSS